MNIRGRREPVIQQQAAPVMLAGTAGITAMLSLSQEGFVVLAEDGCVLDCSTAFLRHLGLRDGIRQNVPFLSLFQHSQPSWADFAAEAQSEAPSPAALSLRLLDGSPVGFDLLAEASGGYIGVLRERSPPAAPRALSEQQAGFVQTARQAGMSAIGTAMAHELNQPLTAMLLYLQTMQRMMGQDEPVLTARYAELAAKSSSASESLRRARNRRAVWSIWKR
jgi:signal transduction histidine kinase